MMKTLEVCLCIFFMSHFHIVLFLGEEKVRSVPWELTKQDELLKKTVVPKRPAVDRKSGAGGSKAGPGGNRSRPPGSYNRNYGWGKGNQHNKRGSRGKSGGSAPRRAKVMRRLLLRIRGRVLAIPRGRTSLRKVNTLLLF